MGKKVIKSLEELRKIRAEADGLSEEYVKNGPGHVTEYTNEMADYICDLIATNALSLKYLKLKYEIPCSTTIFKWLNENEYFAQKYDEAKKLQAKIMFDKISEVTDSLKSYIDSDGVERADAGLVAMHKFKATEYRRMASQLEPKKYSENRVIEDQVNSVHDEVMAQKRRLDELSKRDY
jgi:hypothetical protein